MAKAKAKAAERAKASQGTEGVPSATIHEVKDEHAADEQGGERQSKRFKQGTSPVTRP